MLQTIHTYTAKPPRSSRLAVAATIAIAVASTWAVTSLHYKAQQGKALQAQAALQSQRNYAILSAAFLDNERSPDLALACGAHYWTNNTAKYKTLIDQGIHNYCRGNVAPRAACSR